MSGPFQAEEMLLQHPMSSMILADEQYDTAISAVDRIERLPGLPAAPRSSAIVSFFSFRQAQGASGQTFERRVISCPALRTMIRHAVTECTSLTVECAVSQDHHPVAQEMRRRRGKSCWGSNGGDQLVTLQGVQGWRGCAQSAPATRQLCRGEVNAVTNTQNLWPASMKERAC
jgi:hypothetical protein